MIRAYNLILYQILCNNSFVMPNVKRLPFSVFELECKWILTFLKAAAIQKVS
jgi:hypothetical protein